MKLSMKCATSLAALVLATPLAIAQQPKDDRTGGAPAAQKAPQNNAGGSERGMERSGDNRNDGAGQRGEEKANKKSDSDAQRSDDNKRSETGAKNQPTGEDSRKTRENVKDADSTGEQSRDRREDRAKSDDNKKIKDGTAENRGQKDEGDRGKTAADSERQRSRDQANDRADSAKDRDRNADQAAGDVKPEDRQKAEQVRAKVEEKDRDRLREKAFQGDVRRATNVNVRVNIGTRLPRAVEVYDLPSDIVELAPAYRGYRYVVVGDDYCIIDPETYLIVDVINRSGSGQGEYAYRSGANARLDLTNDQIEIIRKEVSSHGRTFDYDGDLEVGIDLPDQFSFEDFPEPVVERVPTVREYRYVRIEDEIAIVAPDNRQVVYVIGN